VKIADKHDPCGLSHDSSVQRTAPMGHSTPIPKQRSIHIPSQRLAAARRREPSGRDRHRPDGCSSARAFERWLLLDAVGRHHALDSVGDQGERRLVARPSTRTFVSNHEDRLAT
jgi:hypothetical protein